MRSITVTMWVTLDGVVQGLGRPDEDSRGGFTYGGWGQRYNDEVMGREVAKAMAKPGDMLFGRRTWQDFITAWGRLTDGNPFTTHMNAATKYQGETWILDPPEGVCPGQARFEYPATSVPFSTSSRGPWRMRIPGRTRSCCAAMRSTRWPS
jgi:hypothetical protein